MAKNDERIDRLIKDLKNNNWDVRIRATYFLGDIGDKRAVEPLIKALDDKDGDIRWSAARSLGIIGDKQAVEPLLVALANDEDEDVRRQATVALEEMPLTATACQEIKPLLLANVLTNGNKEVRDTSKLLMKKCRGLINYKKKLVV